jgi:hypothetical protein
MFFDHQPKIEHIEPYVDESLLESVTDDSVDVVWRKDGIQDVLEKPDTHQSPFVFSCHVYWDNNFIHGFECTFREIKQGMTLLPLFWGEDTIEECRGTLEYDIALLLSEAPSDAYDMYFDAVGDEFITVGGVDRQVVGPDEESSSEEVIPMEEIAERASIIRIDGDYL